MSTPDIEARLTIAPQPPPLQTIELELGENGTLVLPESIRQQLSLRSGDRLILTVNQDGTLHLSSLQIQIQKLQGIFKNIAPGVSLAEELIRDRRREAQTED